MAGSFHRWKHSTQVDEAVDIFKDHYQEGIGSRSLKLSMTDDAQRVFGIEYRPTPQLKDLEEARQSVVHKVHKPPRGNRHPRGTTWKSSLHKLPGPELQENNGAAANPGMSSNLLRLTASDLSAWELRVFVCFSSNPIRKPGVEENFAPQTAWSPLPLRLAVLQRRFLESGVVQSGRVKLVERMIGHSPLDVSAAIERQAFLKRYQHRVVAVNDYPEMDGGFLRELKLFQFAARIISDPFHYIEFDCSHQENRKETS
ncbi:hypothetical protein SELMODRAFT_416657 [Selaginella moellendorffii]|uniref:Uncharacterized protein n=1 Tax=Selaginella moellendorffii TaxID=88036 RepID=D8RZZ5_SELML|nr:hypothetical protein SELMODRAFT_416652 [Selaginella moellendorffii]EFJ22242.1 hypothetical protein SELMODRAFT_416657 [Selaginella moellendorffii]